MRKTLSLDEFREHMNGLQKELLLERDLLLHIIPRTAIKNREEYAFAYVRAERFGTKAVCQRLDALSWLPLSLDPMPEMMGRHRAPMKRWIRSGASFEPTAHDFGNDLMHALTRSALRNGWSSRSFLRMTSRTANLFQDFACLINIAYFVNGLVANNVEKVVLTANRDLLQTAMELTALIHAPDILSFTYGDPPAKKKDPEIATPENKSPHLHIVHRSDNDGHPKPRA